MRPRGGRAGRVGASRGPTCFVVLAVYLCLAGCAEDRAAAYIAALSDPDPGTRRAAAQELTTLGGAAVAPLLAAADGGSDSLRFIAAQILGSIGDPRALPHLERLSASANPFVAREAVLAMGRCGDAAATPRLTALLAAEPRDPVRGAAAEALAGLRDTLVVPDLLAALADTSASVRRAALAGLHRLWTARSARAARAALQDRDETVRFIAAQILGKRQVEAAVPDLVAALLDSSQWVRTEAAVALGRLGDPAAVRALEGLLRRCEGPDCEAARQGLRDLTGNDYVLTE